MIATFTGRLISVGLPDLRGALHLGFDEASWLGTSFNAALMFIGPFSVYLGGLLGARRVLLGCAGVFTIVSLLLPLAPNLPVLLILLVIAGLTAGTFYPLTLSFVLRSLPMRYVLLGIATYAMDIVFTTNMATSLEAWYMGHLSWRWIFWNSAILTPFMLVLIYFGIPWQPLPHPKEGQPKPNWRGFFYASLGFALLYCALDQGQRLYWWHSGTIVGLAVSGAFLLLMTAVRHLRMPNPLVNFKFLLEPQYPAAGNRFDFLSLLHAGNCGEHTELSGISERFLAFADWAGPVVGWRYRNAFAVCWPCTCCKYVDARLILTFGFALVSIACILNAQLSSAWSGANFLRSQAVMAVGLAFAFNGMVGAIVLEVVNSGALSRPIDVLTFAGFFQTVRLFGGEIGATFMQHFLATREQFHSNILGLSVQLGVPATNQRVLGLTAYMHSHYSGLPGAAGRAARDSRSAGQTASFHAGN